MKTSIPPVLITFALVCIAILPDAQAISPPPDGGYPGGNTAEGQAALLSLTTGGFNTAVGFLSLRSDTVGAFNTGLGAGTLLANNANQNTATGAGALLSNTTGDSNTATGAFALFNNASGSENTANGYQALFFSASNYNSAFGAYALASNVIGQGNNAFGWGALESNFEGVGNNAVGYAALFSNLGDYNTAIGDSAGALLSGHYNICIGAGVEGTFGSNTIRIGDNLPDGSGDSACFIGGINGQTAANGAPVYINTSGQLGTLTSSARFKDDVKPMDKDSETILALKPVTFRYKKQIDAKRIAQFGLVAEEVAKVNPDLVVNGRDGKPYSVRYEAVNAMLLNEFLKEHRTVQEQGAIIAELRRGMEVLAATVKEQAAQIQKVSAQLEARKPAQQVVNNP
jgi:hypothetical protein